jgi:hypothetical protein
LTENEEHPIASFPEYYSWFFGRMNRSRRFKDIGFSVVLFIWFAIIIGAFLRFAWSPIMEAVGSYLLIDMLTTNSLKFEKNGQAYLAFPVFVSQKHRKSVSPLWAMASFVFLILSSGAVSVGVIIGVKWFDKLIPPLASVVLWSFVEGAFLLVSLLRQHKQPIVPPQKKQTPPKSPSNQGEPNEPADTPQTHMGTEGT